VGYWAGGCGDFCPGGGVSDGVTRKLRADFGRSGDIVPAGFRPGAIDAANKAISLWLEEGTTAEVRAAVRRYEVVSHPDGMLVFQDAQDIPAPFAPPAGEILIRNEGVDVHPAAIAALLTPDGGFIHWTLNLYALLYRYRSPWKDIQRSAAIQGCAWAYGDDRASDYAAGNLSIPATGHTRAGDCAAYMLEIGIRCQYDPGRYRSVLCAGTR